MANVIQLRRDTAANWTSVNPTLAAGEFGLETDTGKIKLGNGSSGWTSLTVYKTDKVFDAAAETKLAGIEASADVTDATNVAAAGAFMATNVIDEDTMVSNLDTKVPTQQSVKAYVNTVLGSVANGLEFKGVTDCSGTPNYPAGLVGDFYKVSVAGKIGGASGKTVEVNDAYICTVDNVGGTEAAVGTSWFVLRGNITDATAYVTKALFDANTILAATTDDTPAAITIAEQTIVGRITSGNIKALTVTEAQTLINVENGADVTDATNVNAAGATMNADTTLAGNGYFLDEDAMTSNSDTKVPSQQSVKYYVDNKTIDGGGA